MNINIKYLFFTIVDLTLFKVVWDIIGVFFDKYTFINHENGELTKRNEIEKSEKKMNR